MEVNAKNRVGGGDLPLLTCCTRSFPLLCGGQRGPGVQGLKRIGTLLEPATLERHQPTQRYRKKLGFTQNLFVLYFQEDATFFAKGRPTTNHTSILENRRNYDDRRDEVWRQPFRDKIVTERAVALMFGSRSGMYGSIWM